MIAYLVAPCCGGYHVAVYERHGLVDLQLHHADDGRVWEERGQAEQRAEALRALPIPPYTTRGLCCLACLGHTLFSDFGKPGLCCLACGSPAQGDDRHANALAAFLRETNLALRERRTRHQAEGQASAQ